MLEGHTKNSLPAVISLQIFVTSLSILWGMQGDFDKRNQEEGMKGWTLFDGAAFFLPSACGILILGPTIALNQKLSPKRDIRPAIILLSFILLTLFGLGGTLTSCLLDPDKKKNYRPMAVSLWVDCAVFAICAVFLEMNIIKNRTLGQSAAKEISQQMHIDSQSPLTEEAWLIGGGGENTTDSLWFTIVCA